ncbi:alpha/beta hydrolase family protein [Mesorhizobium australicum]|uniref:alpha/beta hydrolase family protein n=1 Tax=Mesorhizobium australicum TaxID=536018 RepID=UPI003337048C
MILSTAAQSPQTPAEALKAEAARALLLTEFYDTPSTLSATKPGDLLRKEIATEYTLPEGTTVQRILYHSLTASGKDVVTSAAVMLPAGRAPQGGWPVIAWGHGTTGVSRQCAPSLMKDYYGSRLSEYLKAGFAVVATDYYGLGTEGAHHYANGITQGRDVVYSVKAARAAEPELNKRWVVCGHSQGGLTAWGTAAEVHEQNDPDYLGAVAVAGGMQKDRVAAMYYTTTDPNNGALFVMIAHGIKARFPDFDPASMLTDAGMEHYTEVTKGGLNYGYAVFANVKPNTLPKPGWENLPLVDRWFSEFVPGERPIRGPILVIASTGDTLVKADGIEASVARACRAGMAVTFRMYNDLDHSQVFHQSIPDQLAWIRDRFAGKPAPGNCPAR